MRPVTDLEHIMSRITTLQRKEQRLAEKLASIRKELTSTRISIGRMNAAKAELRITKIKVMTFLDTIEGPFTTRSFAEAMLTGEKITGTDVMKIGTILRPLVKEGKLVRTSVNAFDSKNHGQLLYHKV